MMAHPSGPPPAGAVELAPRRPRVYELAGWKGKKNPARVATIAKLGRDAGRDPRLARLAVRIFKEAGVPPRDYKGQARALHEFLRDHVYFVHEIDERLQDPAYTLDLQADGTVGQHAAGDCDDFTIALIALCTSVHLPARAVTSGKLGGKTVRWIEGVGRSPPARWSHIYCAIGDRPFGNRYDPDRWSFADPTVPSAAFGWDVVSARLGRGEARAAGELAGVDDEEIVDVSWKTAAQRVAIGVVIAYAVRLLDIWRVLPRPRV